jgi:hypothetical protein
MNKIFRLRNKAHNEAWIIAKNEERAKEISKEKKFVKDIKNITWIIDQTIHHLNDNRYNKQLNELLKSKKEGVACLAIHGGVMNFYDFVEQGKTGIKKEVRYEWQVF